MAGGVKTGPGPGRAVAYQVGGLDIERKLVLFEILRGESRIQLDREPQHSRSFVLPRD